MILQDVKNVELSHIPEVKPGTKEDGLVVAPHPEIYQFIVDVDGVDHNVVVPNDPLNVDYMVVREWYDRKKNKPFDFDFEPAPEPGKTLPVYSADNPRAATPTVSSNQVEDAKLPPINLTSEQRKELAGE